MAQHQATLRCVDVHALHKSATMFLFKFFRQLSEKQSFDFFSANNTPPNLEDFCGPIGNNSCRCPIRSFEVDEKIDLGAGTKRFRIFHIRDPRDILVSEYFSIGWIHPSDGIELDQRRKTVQEMSIDEYCLQQSQSSQWPLEDKFQPLLNRELDPNHDIVVTYEEMVTDFPNWVSKVLPVFDVRFPKLASLRLAWKYRKEFVARGGAMNHKRRITPGDHRDKLLPKTIDVLNQRFESVLTRFGYLE